MKLYELDDYRKEWTYSICICLTCKYKFVCL